MSSRVAGAGLALIAVALLAVSVATPVVLPAQLSLFAGHPTVADHVRETQDVYVGFYSAELCNSGGDGTCKSGDASNLYLGFRVSGYAELALTAVLMVAALALALMTLRRSEQRKTAAVLIWIAGALALVGAGAMIWQGPFPGASAPLGIGMALHGAGIAGAMIAGVLARRRPPPIRLRVAEHTTQAVAPLPAPHAYDRLAPRGEEPVRASDRGFGFDPRATEPRPRPAAPDTELSDPFASPFTGDRPPFSAQQLRPLYEAAPTQGGTGGLLPIERPPLPMHPPTAMSRPAIGVPPGGPVPPQFPVDEPRRPPSPSSPPPFGEAPRPALPFADDARPMPPPIAGELRPVPRSAHDEPTAMAPPVMVALAADEPVAMGPPMAVASALDEPRPMVTLPPSGELRPPAPSLPPPLPMARVKPPSIPPPLPPPGGSAPHAPVPPSSAPFAIPPPGASAPFAVPPGAVGPFAVPPPGPPMPVPPAPYKARTQVSLVPPMPDNDLPIAPPTAQIVPDPISGTEPTLFPRAETPLAPPPAPVAPPPRPHRESQLPPPRAQRESQLPPPRAQRESQLPPPRPHRESQLPPPRAHRDSQLAPPLRVAVPMPARPSPSPTRPPVPTTLRGAPARPTIATTVPPIPPIPAIPAIPPMPAIPAPGRAQTDVTDPDARALSGDVDPATASRVPVEVDDYTSQTNVSAGAPSPEEINAVDGPGALDGPGDAGTTLPATYVLDTSPSGEPVAPPDVAAIASRPTIQIPEQRPSPILPIVVPPAISPVRDRPMPKLPISTAPDSLPPPKDTKQAIGPSPACPQCESPMAWVEEHLRFYCKSCRMYF